MKYTIGICDDEAFFRREILEVCEKLSQELKVIFSYEEFCNKKEVLAYEGALDFLFLDIQMEGEEDGIEAMEALEHKGNVKNLFFLSSHEEKMIDTFSDITRAFLQKPPSYEKVKKELVKRMQKDQRLHNISIREGGEEHFLALDDLIYLEGESSYVRMVTRDTSYTLCSTLTNWEKELAGGNFIRIHKSYLVNAAHVLQMKDKVMLKGREEELPVGRKYRDTAKEAFKNYKFDQMAL